MPGKNKVALIIVFNHRFDQNIQVLENLYRDRFSSIYYLVPFYDGDHPNVIPVYENSFYFQGYLSQGFKHYFKEDYAHYFFVADDMILNPAINEDTYQAFFHLEADSCFIPEIFNLTNFSNTDTLLVHPHRGVRERIRSGTAKRFTWWRTVEAIYYSPQKKGVENTKEIPSYEVAARVLEKHGYPMQPLQHTDLYGEVKLSARPRDIKRMIAYLLKQKVVKKKYSLNYPVVASYSDLVIVSAAAIKKFIHYCGVFAATELFVELAIPTALLLSADNVLTEPAIGKRGLIYWPYSDEEKAAYEAEMQKYNYNLQRLLQDFPSDKLYMHPVKLSKWKQGMNVSSESGATVPSEVRA
jgi:hypothetical protein